MGVRKKDKVLVVIVKGGKEIGRFRAYLAWCDGKKGRLFDGREVEKVSDDVWVYIVR